MFGRLVWRALVVRAALRERTGVKPRSDGGPTVKRFPIALVLLALCVVVPGSVALGQDGLRLTGSGATFPFPLYAAWFKAFSGKQKGVTVDYQGKGSGAGIQDLINHTVDFAASDAAMTDEQMAK